MDDSGRYESLSPEDSYRQLRYEGLEVVVISGWGASYFVINVIAANLDEAGITA